MQIIKSIIGIIKSLAISLFLVFLVTFMVNNREVVKLSLKPMPFNIETRMFVILVIFFILGIFFGFAILSKNLLSKSLMNFNNNLKLKKLEKKIAAKSDL